jgi:hypothetical protein
MSLSNKKWRRVSLAVAALALVLVGAGPVAAQNPFVPPNKIVRGFQISMAQQRFWQAVEEAPRVLVAAPAPIVTEPRYVTIIGPNGQERRFQIEGPITMVPVRQTVVHFGANNTEGPLVYLPVRPGNIHFGANH